MSRIKYHYNTRTLKYEPYKESLGRKLLRLVFGLATGMVFATAVLLIAYRYLDSPKEKQLKREISFQELQLMTLSHKIQNLEAVLQDLEERDNVVYRAIFAAEPIPNEVRQAGVGGMDRYAQLKGYPLSDLLSEVSEKTDRLSRRLYIQSRSLDEIWQLARQKQEMLRSIPAIVPLALNELKYMASGFGERIDPIYKTRKFHAGMDFVATTGTPVYATGDGKVLSAESETSGYGNCVRIQHGFGYSTLYAHLSAIKVREGKKVKRGDLIGLVGSTGKSVGPHLHYEVHIKGKAVNPINFYYSDLSPEEHSQLLKASQSQGQALD